MLCSAVQCNSMWERVVFLGSVPRSPVGRGSKHDISSEIWQERGGKKPEEGNSKLSEIP